jgi:hypothetical protein
MFKIINEVIQFLSEKAEPIEVLYVKHIPKPIRFILYPISQVILGFIILTSVLSVLVVSALVNAYHKVREAYKDYE